MEGKKEYSANRKPRDINSKPSTYPYWCGNDIYIFQKISTCDYHLAMTGMGGSVVNNFP